MEDPPRLAPPGPALRRAAIQLLALGALVGAGCSQGENPLAPYGGQRALQFLEVTQSYTPDIQWVGGRVAAIGINRGTRAALDSTLVWMRRSSGNDIASFATVGEGSSDDAVVLYGGTPVDSLIDAETYTFWIAEAAALEAALDSTHFERGALADTTVKMRLILRGQTGGAAALGVAWTVTRDQRLLTGETLTLRWTPASVRFRQVAIRRGSTGSFQDLTWHIVSPVAGPMVLAPGIVLSQTPAGAQEAVPYVDFEWDLANDPEVPEPTHPTYIIWASTDDWTGSFAPSAAGYAWHRLLSCNFDIDAPGRATPPRPGFFCD